MGKGGGREGGREGSCLFFSENTVLISLNYVLVKLSSIGGKVWFYIFAGNTKLETMHHQVNTKIT